MSSKALHAVVVSFLLSFGCAGSHAQEAPGSVVDAADDTTTAPDVVASDAADSGADVAPFPVRRLPCVGRTSLAGSLPADAYGALEGELVSIVPPGTKGCPSDVDHLHLQIDVSGKRYDVAITVDATSNTPLAVHTQPVAPSLPPIGWATATFDYEKDLGTPSADYTPLAKDALVARYQKELATAARVRIFGIAYTDGTGVHEIHRNGRDRDGVIIVHRGEPDGGDKAIALRFSNDVF